MSRRSALVLTAQDRMRLGTLLTDRYVKTAESREHLHALESDLEQANAVDPHEVPEDLVTMNSTVEIRDVKSGETETYTLVYPHRADPLQDRISVLAPIGRAILGRRTGDVVRVAVPAGWRVIRIEAIPFQPEREGALDL